MRTIYIMCHNFTNQIIIIKNIFYWIRNHNQYCLYLLLEYLTKKPLVQKEIYSFITSNNINDNEERINDDNSI